MDRRGVACLKELKVRINSVKSTQKITKAMKMVAAAKLRRAQAAAEAGASLCRRGWRRSMPASPRKVAVGHDSAPKLLAGTGSRRSVHLLVVATSRRGPGRRVQHQHRARRPCQGARS